MKWSFLKIELRRRAPERFVLGAGLRSATGSGCSAQFEGVELTEPSLSRGRKAAVVGSGGDGAFVATVHARSFVSPRLSSHSLSSSSSSRLRHGWSGRSDQR